jgi:hypothetical protein
MYTQEALAEPPGLPLAAAADLQDHLLVASNDLDRLNRLLDDASQALLLHFSSARSQLDAHLLSLDGACPQQQAPLQEARQTLVGAVTALQFQDMASQLIAHTTQRLRNCADRLASETFDGDGDGDAVVEPLPLRPNPVTQDEMDAGSVDLF